MREIDGHWQYKEGIAESTTTVRPSPTTWPQYAARLSVNMDDFLWDTTLYDWQTIEKALTAQDEIKLSFTIISYPFQTNCATFLS